MVLVIAVKKGFRVVITCIVNAVFWRVLTSVNVSGRSCGVTSFKNPRMHGQGVSNGGTPVMGASSVCVIVECGGSLLLVNSYLNGCGVGLAVIEQGLLLNMRTCRHADSHEALVNMMSQGVVT